MNSTDEEIKLLYLLSGSCDALPSSCVKLRSYLNTHLSNLADHYNFKLLKSFRNRNKTCPYCYTPWSGDTTSFKLLPSKKFKAHQTRREITEKEVKDASQLNESRNTLVLKCKVCTKRSSFSLVKKKFVEEKPKENNKEQVRKKKKKSNKSCGLLVNLLKPESQPPGALILKKNKRAKHTEELKESQNAQPNSNKNVPVSKKISNSVSYKTKNLLPNPFSSQRQKGISKANEKKFNNLKKAVKQDQGYVKKKTLQDFLTLV